MRTFAIQYYRHVRVSRLYLAALISNCGHDEALQLALAEILFDEYGHLNPDETHPALYRRFLQALGITEEEWEDPPTLPEIELYMQPPPRAHAPPGLPARPRRSGAGERVAGAPDLRPAHRGLEEGDGSA